MKKIVSLIVFFNIYLFAQNSFGPISATIQKIDGNKAYINSSSDLSLGVSGVVIHKFDSSHEAIIASATITKNQNGNIELKLSKFDDIKQDVLPKYNISPKIGDEVLLNYHYNRSMIIAPNKESYDRVLENYKGFEWVHPDIFATFISSKLNATPTKENFKEECRSDDIGLLFFVINGGVYVVDCKTFSIIQKSQITPSTTSQTPFYTRINVKGRMMGFFGDKVKDYNSYYTKLLGGK